MTISRSVRAFQGKATEHHRYRSWEHCYQYFHASGQKGVRRDLERAALHLGFYLASWGMYRGSSFLLQHTYTIHRGVAEVIVQDRFAPLWDPEFGAAPADCETIPLLLELSEAIRAAYRPFAKVRGSGRATDTLVTKVMLGALGCVPACDRYFVDGFKAQGGRFSRLNALFVRRIITFSSGHIGELREVRDWVRQQSGVAYPLMKLVDMHFWQIGAERDDA